MPGPRASMAEMDILQCRVDLMGDERYDDLAVGLALYGDAVRLRVFALLRYEILPTAEDLRRILEVPRHELSVHLAQLRGFGLIEVGMDGERSGYSLTDHPLNRAMDTLLTAHEDAVEPRPHRPAQQTPIPLARMATTNGDKPR